MFEPWIGKAYGAADNIFGGTRLLVVGESHYCDGDDAHLAGTSDDRATTEAVMQLALTGQNVTFNTLTSMLLNCPFSTAGSEDVRRAWDAIVFYNYVPKYLARYSRPTVAQWHAGSAPFREVLKRHAPQAVFVCGATIWDWIHYAASKDGKWPPRPSTPAWIEGIPYAYIRHPSRHRSLQKNRAALDGLIREIE